MAVEDLEYVERATGISLDEDKPLSDVRRQKQRSGRGAKDDSGAKAGASIEPKKDEYDWFDFFLKCGVGVHQCERYAMNFSRDSMDETVLPDITASNLRTLGLKEGDTLRVMKFLDNKFGRTAANRSKRNVSFGGTEVISNGEGEEDTANGGLFSGPGGALRNNTRKGRPAPAVQTNDVVDPKAFDQDKSKNGIDSGEPSSSPTKAPPPIAKDDVKGFDDDAWAVKPSKQPAVASPATTSPLASSESQPNRPQQSLTGSLKDLSLLSPPLQPTIVHSTGSQQVNGPQQPQQLQPQPQPQQQQQTAGATPSFFSQLGPQPTGTQIPQNPAPSAPPLPAFIPQQTGLSQQQNIARPRPQPPQMMQNQSSLMPPPPPRPLSAPQNASQQGGFGPPPLQPQLTGYQNTAPYQPQLAPHIAPPGQSLNDLNQIRQQQQPPPQQPQQQFGQPQLMPQLTGYNPRSNGFAPQPTGYGQQGIAPQQTGYGQQQSQQNNFQPAPPQQQFLNSQATGSPFANPGQPSPFQSLAPQPTGYLQPQATGINSILPPALQPQQTGANGYGQGFGQSPPPMPPLPPMPSMPAAAPLQPQKTGPPPPVRFGLAGDAKKLMPQATGRRANLSAASKSPFFMPSLRMLTIVVAPENPFGF